MPKIELWSNFPSALRQHLIERMRDRSITLADLNQLRLWIETDPEVPDDEWYKDFGHSNYAENGDIRKLSCWQVNSSRNKAIAGFAQKILGGHRPPLQLGVRNCRGAL